jgi:hypothetical protein
MVPEKLREILSPIDNLKKKTKLEIFLKGFFVVRCFV